MTKLLFLPGAGASAGFWVPVARLLDFAGPRHFFSWPGLGNEPHHPEVRGLDDLVALVVAQMTESCDLIAQSMGGLVAIRAALAAPERVRRLVLTATSGGVPMNDLGGADWQAAYRRDFPDAATWITEVRQDLSPRLNVIAAPTLLLWGDSDAISPPAVGERLAELLPHAELRILRDGGHDLALTHATQIAPLIEAHLR